MKRAYLIFPYLFILLPYLNSQVEFNPKTCWGLNQGINISYVKFSPAVGQFPRYNYTGGITFIYVSEPNLGVQIEFNYSERGWEEIFYTESYYKRSLRYLEIPFLTYVEIGNRNFKFILNGGPTLSTLLNQNEKVKIDTQQESKEYYGIAVKNYFDFGLSGGGGFKLESKIGSFQIDGRFTFGLTNIFSIKDIDYYSKSQNQFFSIKLCYLISI